MASARDNIITQIVTLLGTIGGVTVDRSRDVVLARSETPKLIAEPEEESVEYQSAGLAVRSLVVLITLFMRSDTPDTVADPYVQAINSKLMKDPTLGGLAARVIEQSTKWTFETADRTALACEIRYLVKYQTPAADLSQLS